jgi:hypothetical protein
VLDGGSVFGERDFEGGAAAAAGAWAGGVMVVAEVFSAKAWAAAAVAVGEDVAALVAFGFGLWCLVLFDDGGVHWSLPTGYFLVQSLQRKGVESGLPSSDFAVKGEGPAFGQALFLFSYLF